MLDAIARLVPAHSLPSYSYVPGRFPHPFSDPAGHSFGHVPGPSAAIDPARWPECQDYLLGIDLFNHGYYWEAHEVWEGLWHAAGRRGATANLLQGLIKLAAAAVKVRQGKAAGTVGLARGAAKLFDAAAEALGDPQTYLGFSLAELRRFAQLACECASDSPDQEPGVRRVYPFVLRPAFPPSVSS